MAPSSDAFGMVVRIVGGGSVAVGSTAMRVTNPTWLTDAQIRATPLVVQFSSTQQIVVGEVEVKNDLGNPIPIYHASLDITLSALRNAIAGSTATAKTIADLFTRLGDGSQVVLGPLTNTELRASPVAVSSTAGVRVSNSTAQRIPVTSTGTVGLNAVALAALENITVQNGTAAAIPVAEQNQLVPKKFGYIALAYSTFAGSTARKLTQAVYHAGSSTTATVATLTLRYSTSLQLASVGRT